MISWSCNEAEITSPMVLSLALWVLDKCEPLELFVLSDRSHAQGRNRSDDLEAAARNEEDSSPTSPARGTPRAGEQPA